jgi:hypothetical protein
MDTGVKLPRDLQRRFAFKKLKERANASYRVLVQTRRKVFAGGRSPRAKAVISVI